MAEPQPFLGETLSIGSQNGQIEDAVPIGATNPALKLLLLHGNLDVVVSDAKNLPNMDLFHDNLRRIGKLTIPVKGKIREHLKKKITSDPYVTITVADAVIGRTYVISNCENPEWRQRFHVPVAHFAKEVYFLVKDNDVVGSELIGSVGISVESLLSGSTIEGTFPVLGPNGKPCNHGSVLSLSIKYTPVEKVPIYHTGGVPGTYFPLRKGGKVALYQDAHVQDQHGCVPCVKLENNMDYHQGNCWRDIFDAINQARHLVYITGWSLSHEVKLVRDIGNATESVLGDLLKRKSGEGVRVLLLIWDDPSSVRILSSKKVKKWSTNKFHRFEEGVMNTDDEVTQRFFKHSSVEVILCPRSTKKGHSLLKKPESRTIYTHHQKTVIVDVDAGNHKRKLIAFVGGLDLCFGRYDTPSHPILKTLKTVHSDDYHNPNLENPSAGSPRQPWHDLHCRIEGPAAYDVLTNFEERWRQASEPHGLHRLKMSIKTPDDRLLQLDTIPEILCISDISDHSEDDREAWHVQVFRSIDSNSVKGFPEDPKDAPSKNLACGKNVLIDMSIQTAYIKAIRSARHFIYIENQYFLGSSYNWDEHQTAGANNLIPIEIALKIANKIKTRERFSVYIVIPMWPEGVPTKWPIQKILFWQRKTMEMMYKMIYKALEEVGLDDEFEPQDYLNFFCLGNRDGPDGEDSTNPNHPAPSRSTQESARRNRRFMIYVHSKGMIVDDEYVLLGSANINQRSLEGTRDTEIAMGAYQSHHSWARKQSCPRGEVHGYRMSLWAEHLGTIEECFYKPESVECTRQVRSQSESNWQQYVAEEVTELKGHLLKYPLQVDRKGNVSPLPNCRQFPDVGGVIEGSLTTEEKSLRGKVEGSLSKIEGSLHFSFRTNLTT